MLRALALLLFVCTALAQEPKPYEPSYGQAGKDVVWVPTPQPLVDVMLDMAQVTPEDFVMDLGSGDGRLVIAAAKRGARALGIEYDGKLVEYSRRTAEQEGVAARASFAKQDLFEADLSQASVITLFLLPQMNLKLRPKLLALRPGSRIVANTFTLGEWKSDASADYTDVRGCDTLFCNAFLWIVPARVAGTHRTPLGELTLVQDFQFVNGTLRSGGASQPVEGRLRGAELRFTAGGREYRARMNGTQLELH